MSNAEVLELEQGAYQGPENLKDYADRDTDGKRLILYIGDRALLDIVELQYEDSDEVVVLGKLLLRLEANREQALDLFYHPSPFASAEDAKRVFESQKQSPEVKAA